ncbi:hypothetical protein [Paraburkholderia antibiotica]|uniref:Uncharacterized protein n=1 Tax=Paraburkholderia antibiotica TaxID=2728839 RepID=A0A7Y0A1T4_9BURK|nr:hypothetical protein [Paraburkholderia antibiotica]NML34927.1 hypothetical protein [Paraburkholderia antibiotica]
MTNPTRYGTSCAPREDGVFVHFTEYEKVVRELEELRLNERSDAPRRAVQFTLDLQADSIEALSSALYNLSNQIAARDMSRVCISGGYDSGYTFRLEVSEGPTHDEYVKQLNAWIEARDKEKA